MLPLHEYDAFVRAVYSAASAPGMWKHFIALLSESFASARVALYCHDHTSNVNLGALDYGFDPEFVEAYRQEYAAISPYAPAQALGPVGVVLSSHQLVDRATMRNTRFYQEWIRPQEDIAAGAGITICRDGGRFLRLGCNIRLRDEERVQARLERTLELLAPHLLPPSQARCALPAPMGEATVPTPAHDGISWPCCPSTGRAITSSIMAATP